MTHVRLMTASVVVCVLAVVAMVAASLWYTKHSHDDLRSEQIAGCERANQQRMYINKIIEHHPKFELPPIPIPDCNAIIK